MREWEREEQDMDLSVHVSWALGIASGPGRIIQRSLFLVILCKEGWATCPWGWATTAALSRVSLALCQHGGFPVLAGMGEHLLSI